jgi:hypothetical protein
MAKRVIVEFICDVCARIIAFEHVSHSFAGSVATVNPYPKGWKSTRSQGKTVDACPDCDLPIAEEIAK